MILFAHSNFMVQDAKQMERMRPYPPLSTLIAAALCRRQGHEVALFDATFAEGIEAFERYFHRTQPRVVAIMDDNFNFLTKMCTTVRRESALAMIRLAAARNCHVVVNGPDASDNPVPYFEAGAEAVIEGEGETTMLRLADLWGSGETDLKRIAGLVLPDSGTTGPYRAERDLDLLPFPAWDLVDAADYRSAWNGALSWNIATSRGCPYACNWCAKPIFGRRYTVRSPGNVVAEMRRLKRDIAPDHLWFTDDILGLDADWIDDFADEVAGAKRRIPFTMQSRVNLITERTPRHSRAVARGKCGWALNRALRRSSTRWTRAPRSSAARTATRLLREHGIRACWFIQLGYPSEEWDDLIATRDLIRDERPTKSAFRLPIRSPAPSFTTAFAPSSARSAIGRTPASWRCCSRERSKPACIAGSATCFTARWKPVPRTTRRGKRSNRTRSDSRSQPLFLAAGT